MVRMKEAIGLREVNGYGRGSNDSISSSGDQDRITLLSAMVLTLVTAYFSEV